MPPDPDRRAIHLLDDATVSRIAAGEVVERPASIVKELVENSLDAGATRVVVAIEEGGIARIAVTDDGAGVPSAELALAFQRHATSKVRSADDIVTVATLGFRGEALAAIASVASVRMVSRSGREDGAEIRLSDGTAGPVRPVGAAPGTAVEVEGLFASVPARRNFLASAVTEGNRIVEVVARIALAFPAVQFTLTRDGRDVLATPGTGRRRDAVAAVLGRGTTGELVDARGTSGTSHLVGLVSPPHLHRATRRDCVLYVNSRWIQDKTLAHALTQAYRNLLPKSRFPVAIVWLELAPEEVDVNVHPAKTEVRFRQPDRVFGLVMRAVREAAAASGPAPVGEPYSWKEAGRWPTETARAGTVPDWVRLLADDVWGPAPRSAPGDAAAERSGSADAADAASEWPSSAMTSSSGPQSILRERPAGGLPPLRVLGQVNLMYIAAEGPDGLVILDQHAAHERVLFEKMMASDGPVPSQALLQPVDVEMGAAEASAASDHAAALARLGFLIEPFGPRALLIRGVPDSARNDDPASLLSAVLDELASDGGKASAETRIATVVCKRASVKGGQTLTYDEMTALVRGLEAAREPLTCPHGRPTVVAFDAARLAREFGRT